jgi:beta-phosphoglucomutase-like phosphatase (HAD superfamily)
VVRILCPVNGCLDNEFPKLTIEHFKLSFPSENFLELSSFELHKRIPNYTLISGVSGVIYKIFALGITMAVTVSDRFEMKTKNHQDIFSKFNCGDDASEAKPDPEIFKKASSKFGYFSGHSLLCF